MALPASDSFTNANATALNTHNAGWTMAVSSWEIRDNKANTTVDADSYAFWNADSFNANQYSKAAISGMSSFAEYRGVIARAAGTGGSFRGYLVYTDGQSGAGHTSISKVTGGTSSDLKVVATTFAANDIIEIRVTGTTTTTIALYKNGALVDSVTDSSSPYTDGAAGIYSYGNTPGLDNWQADNIAASSSVAPLAQAHYRRRRAA
jgi:hypothetical protein